MNVQRRFTLLLSEIGRQHITNEVICSNLRVIEMGKILQQWCEDDQGFVYHPTEMLSFLGG